MAESVTARSFVVVAVAVTARFFARLRRIRETRSLRTCRFGRLLRDDLRIRKKVTLACVSLGMLAVGYFNTQLGKGGGNLSDGIFRVLVGLSLPVVGWRGATLDDGARPWRLWTTRADMIFDFLCRTVMGIVITLAEFIFKALQAVSPENGPWLQPNPEVLPTYPAAAQGRPGGRRRAGAGGGPARPWPDGLARPIGLTVPGLHALVDTLPYWACATFAAYFSLDLYTRLLTKGTRRSRGTS